MAILHFFSDAFSGVNWGSVITLALPAIVAIYGWFRVHRLNSERDLAIRRREARIKCLESAFMRLATASNKALTPAMMDEIETFVSEIQLYGTPTQFKLLQPIVEGLKRPNNAVSFDAMLLDLRDTIRHELHLEPLPKEIWWFRFNREPTSSSPLTAPPERPGGDLANPGTSI